MSRHKITRCLPALLLLFHLGYPIFAPSGSAKTGSATVSGRVTLNGEPVRGVAVMMQPQRQLSLRLGPQFKTRRPMKTGDSVSPASRRGVISSRRSRRVSPRRAKTISARGTRSQRHGWRERRGR